MTATTFCASAGVRVLLQVHSAAGQAGARLRVAVRARLVRRVLELTGADQVLEIYAGPDEALAGPASGR